jgi:hypothetical protein
MKAALLGCAGGIALALAYLAPLALALWHP